MAGVKIMKLFKDDNNQIFAYEKDGSQDHLISENLILITQSEADLIIAENQEKEFSKLSYKTKRELEYPSITDQLDALFHAGVFPPEMAEQIRAIKDKYPKPE
jgi:hypothetical protein